MASGIIDWLIRASIPAIVLTVFALARKHFPVKPARSFAASWSLEELNARFAYTQWFVGAGMLLTGGAIAWRIHSILVDLNQFVAALDGPSDFVLLPQAAIWWFLPGFAAITLAWEITIGAWSLFGDPKKAMLYNYRTTTKAGFDSTRVLRIMAVPIVLPIGILTALAIPEHAALGSDEIRTRGYGFSRPRMYRYSEARTMTIIEGFRRRDGSLVERAGVVLDFSDGRRWSSADISDFRPSVDPNLADFLQAKTGLKPQYAVAASEIPR